MKNLYYAVALGIAVAMVALLAIYWMG
jgi:hypothetical protein